MAHSLAEHWSTPFSIGFAQAILDACRSKRLISMGNQLGMWSSHPTLQRIDTSLAKSIIKKAKGNRVPITPPINEKIIIHAAVDNFDKNDGKEGSHDTISMLFQNGEQSENISEHCISKLDEKRDHLKLVSGMPETDTIEV